MTHDVNCGVYSMFLDRDCIANYRVAPISKTYLLHIKYSYTIYLLKEPKYNQIKYRKSLENK